MLLKSLLFSFSIFSLISCASPGKTGDCAQIDWYERGRQEGAAGQTQKTPAGVAQTCEGASYPLYLQGHNAGLAEYCTPGNAFHIGKADLPYVKGLCPSLVEKDFLKALEKGRRMARLENQKRVESID
jgi:hypothetical protein